MCLDLLIYWYLTIYFLIISTSSGDTVDCRRYINVRQITIGSRLTDIMSMHGNYIDYASKNLFFLGIVGIGMLLGIYQLYNLYDAVSLYHRSVFHFVWKEYASHEASAEACESWWTTLPPQRRLNSLQGLWQPAMCKHNISATNATSSQLNLKIVVGLADISLDMIQWSWGEGREED